MDQSALIDRYLKPSYWIEVLAGLFFIIAIVVLFALSLGIAGYNFKTDRYTLFLVFSDAGGLKKGASVELAGVTVGEVEDITIEGVKAIVKVSISDKVKIRTDDIFSINTKGLIGDKFVKITPGASDEFVQEGAKIYETVDSVDIEGLISRIVGKFVESK
ncbi:MAG: MlaD family protein [Deltaproteobacteria bacterium]|nr:MlaD family protein [Deltaproteobacteria bacterium]